MAAVMSAQMRDAEAPSAEPVGIAIEGVSKAFGPVQALVDIDVNVRAGEFLSLIGPSGCGKTTLLKAIAGLMPVDAGRVVKGVGFVDLVDAGDPVELAARYAAEGADEIVILNVKHPARERDHSDV